jgi:hypothetical protein
MSARRPGEADVETIASYTAVIRHELGLRPGEDAVVELERRLRPEDAAERPPRRAPAVVRLNATLRALRRRRAPDASLDEVTEDLRFLRVFEKAPLEREALERLLDDVMGGAPNAATREPRPPNRRSPKRKVVRMRRRGAAK